MLSITQTGEVSMTGSRVRLTSSESLDEFVYAIMIQNTDASGKKVRIRKVDIDDPTETYLEGAVFDLYLTGSSQSDTLLYEDVVSGDDGLLSFDGQTVISLLPGVYKLVEKTPPTGYLLKTYDITITVTDSDVTYDEGTVFSSEGTGLSYDSETEVYTLLVSNEINNIIPPTGMNERNYLVMILLFACFIVMACSAVYRSKRRKGV